MHDPAYERSLKVVHDRIAHHFGRAEPRRRAWNYLLDLPQAHSAGLRRGETVGHYSGELRADGVQRLLTSACWDEFGVRDELRGIAAAAGGRTGGTLFVTEVAFPKKGRTAVAVERQYSHDTQRVENCQIGLLLFHLTAGGQVFLIDSELYLPPAWVGDTRRRHQARIPPETAYRSKSALAAAMVARAWESSIRPAWVACNLICADRAALHRALRHYGLQHVVAGSAGEMQAAGLGRLPAGQDLPAASAWPTSPPPGPSWPGHETLRLPGNVLHRFPVRTAVRTADLVRTEMSYLLLSGTDRAAPSRSYYTACLRPRTGLAEVVPVVHLLGGAPEVCRTVKEQTGLGHYEVRSWRGWYRHLTLASAAQIALELARQEPAGDVRTAVPPPAGRSSRFIDLRDPAYAAADEDQAS